MLSWIKKTSWVLAIAVLTAVPFCRLAIFLVGHGGANPMNDEWLVPNLLEKMASGHYPWRYFLRDSYISAGHSNAVPMLFQWLTEKLGFWSIPTNLYFGLFLSLGKLFLLFLLFSGKLRGWRKWILLPLLSALVFAPSQLSTFEFSLNTLQISLNHFGFLLGLWGLLRFKNRWSGIAWMAVGGLLATWSWGGGVFLWPIFFLVMMFSGFSKKSHYVVWLFVSLLATSPYIYFILFKSQGSAVQPHFFPNFQAWFQALGWPFIQGFDRPAAYSRGIWGFALGVIGILLVISRRGAAFFREDVSAIAVILYAVINLLVIGVLRGTLMPWYAGTFMFYWIGLVGLVFLDGKPDETEARQNRLSPRLDGIFRSWAVVFFAVLGYFYLSSNLTFQDKSVYMQSRSPVSETCLRNYRTAPTYCEASFFLWDKGQLPLWEAMARPLERLGLSVFSSHQRWTLQGDFVTRRVKVHEEGGVIPDVHWSDGLNDTQVPFTDYRRLNLFLHSPNSVDWTVTLPRSLKTAEFHSAVAISHSAPFSADADGLLFKVSVTTAKVADLIMFAQYVPAYQNEWIPFSFPLERFAGETITFHLGSEIFGNPYFDWAMVQYPFIDLKLSRSGPPEGNTGLAPENTDLSEFLPSESTEDLILDLGDGGPLGFKGVQITERTSDSLVMTNLVSGGELDYRFDHPPCVGDYSHLRFAISVPETVFPRAVRVYFQIQGNKEIEVGGWVPLLTDRESHVYTYDLKMLELQNMSRLAGIRFIPVESGMQGSSTGIKLTGLRLLRSTEKSFCGAQP